MKRMGNQLLDFYGLPENDTFNHTVLKMMDPLLVGGYREIQRKPALPGEYFTLLGQLLPWLPYLQALVASDRVHDCAYKPSKQVQNRGSTENCSLSAAGPALLRRLACLHVCLAGCLYADIRAACCLPFALKSTCRLRRLALCPGKYVQERFSLGDVQSLKVSIAASHCNYSGHPNKRVEPMYFARRRALALGTGHAQEQIACTAMLSVSFATIRRPGRSFYSAHFRPTTPLTVYLGLQR